MTTRDNTSTKRLAIDFPGRYYDEEVVLLCRRTNIPFLFVIFVVVLLFPLPLLLLWTSSSVLRVDLLQNDANSILFVMGATIYYIILGTVALRNWIDYYFDVTVITDRRIVDVDQKGLFHRYTSETNLEDVMECVVRQHGILQSIFNYGTVDVKTAVSTKHIEMHDVIDPVKVSNTITSTRDQIEREKYSWSTRRNSNGHPPVTLVLPPVKHITSAVDTAAVKTADKHLPPSPVSPEQHQLKATFKREFSLNTRQFFFESSAPMS